MAAEATSSKTTPEATPGERRLLDGGGQGAPDRTVALHRPFRPIDVPVFEPKEHRRRLILPSLEFATVSAQAVEIELSRELLPHPICRIYAALLLLVVPCPTLPLPPSHDRQADSRAS